MQALELFMSNHSTDLSLGVLAVLNFVLGFYVFKRLPTLVKKNPHLEEKNALWKSIRDCQDPNEKIILLKSYDEKGFAQDDVALFSSRSKKDKISALRKVSHLGAPAYLYEIKRLLDDKDDSVALYAFRAITHKHASWVNLDLLKKIAVRSAKKKTLMTSAILKIAECSNCVVLMEFMQTDIPAWLHVNCMHALVKAGVSDVIPLLMTFQDHSLPQVQKTAQDLLAKIDRSHQAA